MKFYIDITLIPGVDVSYGFLWGKVYQAIHSELVKLKDHAEKVPIGVAFPEYLNPEQRFPLGSKLRFLAADEAGLEKLDIKKCLYCFRDYIHCTSIRTVPSDTNIKYVRYVRQHPNQSGAKLRRLIRRKAEREGVSIEVAQEQFSEDAFENLKTPFVRLRSGRTQQKFCLFIQKVPAERLINEGFNTYGLSHGSTVPEF